MKTDFSNAACENGFTLIEILIAMLIFAIGTLAIATMQSHAMRGNSLGKEYTEATTIGTDQMQYLLSLPYTDADLQDTNGNDTGGLENGTEAVPALPDHQLTNGNYTIFWNVAKDQYIQQTKTVALYVRWQRGENSHLVRMRDIVPQLF